MRVPSSAGAEAKISITVGSPGLSNGRNASGMWNTWSWRVVLNITVTEPLILKRSPRPGRPRPAEALTLRKPATPAFCPGVKPVTMMIRPVAAPKVI